MDMNILLEAPYDGPPLGSWLEASRRWFGLTLHIENPAGSTRQWPGGSTYMLYDYGEIKKTDGEDGEPVDVYVGPKPATAKEVYIVHQLMAPHFMSYDEDKCFIGFSSGVAAKRAYEAHFTNPAAFGGMTTMSTGDFVQHIKDHGTCPNARPVTSWDMWNTVKEML